LPFGKRADMSQDALAVPYSSTPPAMDTKVMDWMPYLAALSARKKPGQWPATKKFSKVSAQTYDMKYFREYFGE